jgi:hypothetical protein
MAYKIFHNQLEKSCREQACIWYCIIKEQEASHDPISSTNVSVLYRKT